MLRQTERRMVSLSCQVTDVVTDDSHYNARSKSHHPGAVIAFGLDSDEEVQWRRWSPKAGDVVIIELQDGTTWPGKVRNGYHTGFVTSLTLAR
jgi:hypothetical protein